MKPLLLFILASVSSLAYSQTTEQDLEIVRSRYLNWVLDTEQTDYNNPHINGRYGRLQRSVRGILNRFESDFDFSNDAPFYDTRTANDDLSELQFLVTQALPHLSTAYHLKGPDKRPNPYYRDKELHRLILLSFDRLHQRGFRKGLLMPWKTKEVADEPTPARQGIVVDFHLRTSGFALATFLMRDTLEESGKLERTLETCRDIMSHDEKFGSLYDLKQNADGIRLVANFSLPYALAAGDLEHLNLIGRQVDRSMAKESDASDTIKPDGLGFHHRAVYLSGYAPFGVAQSAFLAWLLDGTGAEVQPVTIGNMTHSMEVLRLVSQKYEGHKSLAGRLTPSPVIPQVLLGYAYLADLEHPGRSDVERILARLADESFMNSPAADRVFSAQRNEVPPGAGAVSSFYRILHSARQGGAEPDPSGNWAFNYGPISVHRRDHWMASVKGYSKYWWAFERSLVDARMDDRLQNVLGFHDSACYLSIHTLDNETNPFGTGRTRDGWNWCRIPGATTRQIPGKDFLEMDRQSDRTPIQRPFAESSFVGGLSLDRKHGLFAAQYHEVGPDRRKGPLRAMKAFFFFGDQIVAFTHNIKNGDGVYPVETTLFQTPLAEADTPTWINGKPVKGLEKTKLFEEPQPVTLVDSANHGYYLPRAEGLIVQREEQTHLDQSGTTPTTGNFASARFQHGKSPDGDHCEYVILPSAGPDKTSKFASEAHNIYNVVQRNSRGIIVQHYPLGLTGYVLPNAGVEIEKGLIREISVPCFAMTEKRGADSLRLSVCNPDLGWEAGKQFDYKKDSRDPNSQKLFEPVSMPLTITLRGRWNLAHPHPEIEVKKSTKDSTTLTFATSDARSIECLLNKLETN
ncbi:MAG: polysaccharide lyase family 8 super-sandwich domain-containing protein [Verrucomicrobiales bacterium]